MATAVLEPPYRDWQAALGKKQSFEETCKSLCSDPEALAAPQCRPLLARVRTLLRSRFTGRPFWVAGRELFRAAEAAAAQAQADEAFKRQLQEYITECDEFLGDAAGPSGGPSDADAASRATSGAETRSQYLFEGQLSGQGASAPRTQPSLLDMLGGVLAQQLQAQQQPDQEGGGLRDTGGEQQQESTQPDSSQEDQHMHLTPEMLEALERELDAVAVQIMEESGQTFQPVAPPASKKVVAGLPKEQLTAERLEQLGGADTRCPVCMDEFSEGDEVQVMPCHHVFHPPCLAPWLENNNSCPTCRHELPTDDQQYERRKEREQREEEERRGAANAVSHNEFLYI